MNGAQGLGRAVLRRWDACRKPKPLERVLQIRSFNGILQRLCSSSKSQARRFFGLLVYPHHDTGRQDSLSTPEGGLST